MEGQIVDFKFLPSRGYSYPQDLEIYVKPLSIKEQIDMERYGISDAEYFQSILNGITIRGNFNKNNLLHCDVQFIDIVRRLFSFNTKDKILIEDCVCNYRDCEHKFTHEFYMEDLDFTPFSPDIFGKRFVLCEGTEDELAFTVSPLTVSEYLKMSRTFRNIKSKKDALSTMYTDYMCACIRYIEGRTYRDEKERNAFLKNFIDNLYMAKDKKVLKQIVDETISKLEPFKVICEECGRETEVIVTPSSNFQQ